MVPLATDIITSELTGRPSPVASLKEQDIPYYGVNGEWKECIPYYGVNSQWKELI